MPQREDSGVFVLVAHRQQPQQRERVGHTEPGQSKQRNGSSSRSAQRRSPSPRGRGPGLHRQSCFDDQSGHDQDGRGFRHPQVLRSRFRHGAGTGDTCNSS